jgi:hypothetical protein
VADENIRWQERVKVAKGMNANGAAIEFIAKCLEQSVEDTQAMIDLTADNARKPFF